MAFDFKFDPVTRDLVIGANGSPVLTQTAETMVMHQLLIHYGEWWGGPNLGSKLWDLRAFGAKPEITVPAEAMRALQLLVARGRIAAVEVKAEVQKLGRIAAATRFRDVRTNTTVSTVVKAGG